ncbi:Protein tas [Porphyridium purpureum]|uniref:Protein tas n=1 Tax=Porphyridium purpureum TaxID=35688 RepID=A0A5J4YK59_PORPP|nr:Protein tas [Porphyridium purpureum]|eukprot:POR3441..scf210_14
MNAGMNAGGVAPIARGMLGSSDMSVTRLCLGKMTWGIQNSEAEAHQQLDYAIKQRGINFIDTAEMYPVPGSAPGWKAGRTEEFIGTWLAKNAALRGEIYVATKVAGYMPSSGVPGQRKVPPLDDAKLPCRLDRESVLEACDASLRRLQTSYIDLYQLHWPDRYVAAFGSTAYDPSKERKDSVPLRETLDALRTLLEQGKIKHYGLSNETTFGVCEVVRAADEMGMPRPVSIQNSFSLLHRSFETELAEACAPSNYNIGLLPWSVLAGGALSGKYEKGARPAGARHTEYKAFQPRFFGESVLNEVVPQYAEIARSVSLTPAALAIAFCRSRWYIHNQGSCIIGATTMEQLKECIDAYAVELDAATLDAIDRVHLWRRDPVQGL